MMYILVPHQLDRYLCLLYYLVERLWYAPLVVGLAVFKWHKNIRSPSTGQRAPSCNDPDAAQAPAPPGDQLAHLPGDSEEVQLGQGLREQASEGDQGPLPGGGRCQLLRLKAGEGQVGVDSTWKNVTLADKHTEAGLE